jgi:hypothetical protein
MFNPGNKGTWTGERAKFTKNGKRLLTGGSRGSREEEPPNRFSLLSRQFPV